MNKNNKKYKTRKENKLGEEQVEESGVLDEKILDENTENKKGEKFEVEKLDKTLNPENTDDDFVKPNSFENESFKSLSESYRERRKNFFNFNESDLESYGQGELSKFDQNFLARRARAIELKNFDSLCYRGSLLEEDPSGGKILEIDELKTELFQEKAKKMKLEIPEALWFKGLISVKTLQEFRDAEPELIDLTTEGEILIDSKEGAVVITYHESDPEDLDSITSYLIARVNQIVMIKEGSFKTELYFKKNYKEISKYETPYGEFRVETLTESFDFDYRGFDGEIKIVYWVSVAGTTEVKHTLTINYKVSEADRNYKSSKIKSKESAQGSTNTHNVTEDKE